MWHSHLRGIHPQEKHRETIQNPQQGIPETVHADCTKGASQKHNDAHERRHSRLMGCDVPLTAYRSQEFNPATGRYLMTFNSKNSLSGTPIKVPCGRCTGCKLEKSRQWAVRCNHEAQMHPANCFVTLTYDRANLPVDYSVHPREMQLFMKKLRKHTFPTKIRFYLGAEYGDENLRPHYHVLIFNYDFNDKIFYEKTTRGDTLYTSATLSKLWGKGLATVGALTFHSAGYTARYSTKKITGPKASDFYLRTHPDHGFICRVRPEFSLMSRGDNSGDPVWGGGIGRGWLEKFKSDVYPSDEVISNGRKARPPRFYDKQLPEEELRKYTIKRQIEGKKHAQPETFNHYLGRTETRAGKMRQVKRNL
nr:MAG: replication initiator protein [Microvirus sp.]